MNRTRLCTTAHHGARRGGDSGLAVPAGRRGARAPCSGSASPSATRRWSARPSGCSGCRRDARWPRPRRGPWPRCAGVAGAAQAGCGRCRLRSRSTRDARANLERAQQAQERVRVSRAAHRTAPQPVRPHGHGRDVVYDVTPHADGGVERRLIERDGKPVTDGRVERRQPRGARSRRRSIVDDVVTCCGSRSTTATSGTAGT